MRYKVTFYYPMVQKVLPDLTDEDVYEIKKWLKRKREVFRITFSNGESLILKDNLFFVDIEKMDGVIK